MPPPIVWIATTATLVGLGLVALARRTTRAKPANRLLLYRYADRRQYVGDTARLGIAVAATITPSGFYVESQVEMEAWDLITSARSGGKNWLLLINHQDETVATGLVDENFKFKISQRYPYGSPFFPWQTIEPNNLGYLLLSGIVEPDGSMIGFGQVLDDGTLMEWWRKPLPIDMLPQVAFGFKDVHAWYVNDPAPGVGATVYIYDIKHAQVLCTRRFDGGLGYPGMVVDGDLIYFYDKFATTEICTLDSNHQLVRVRRKEDDREIVLPIGELALKRIASTPGAHLCYDDQRTIGPAEIRVLKPTGFPITARVPELDATFYFYVRC
jgi:hypothetical protein